MTMHRFDAMTEPELGKLFTEVCEWLKWKFPPSTGFIVLAGPFNEPGVAMYASNAQREDCIRWMEETIARFRTGDVVARGTAVDVEKLMRQVHAARKLHWRCGDDGVVRGREILKALEEA